MQEGVSLFFFHVSEVSSKITLIIIGSILIHYSGLSAISSEFLFKPYA